MTTKPETKQEMAEWLAVEVLIGRKLTKENCEPYCIPKVIDAGICWYTSTPQSLWTTYNLEQFIYSPDGFSTVWDALDTKFERVDISFCYPDPNNPTVCELNIYNPDYFPRKMGTGKDRYEAFYNAVYQAMNDPN
jgi:hypothetical protein